MGYKYAYSDLSWVSEQGEEVEQWKALFFEWSTANIYITKLLSGDTTVLESYVDYINKHRNELVMGLLHILRAANKNQFVIDYTLECYKQELSEILNEIVKGRYSRNLAMDRQASLIYELAYYYLYKGDYPKGFDLLLTAIKNFQQINNEKYILESVILFEKFRSNASQEIKLQYQTLLLGGDSHEEKGRYTSYGS